MEENTPCTLNKEEIHPDLKRKVTKWLPILKPKEVRGQLDQIGKVPTKLSTGILDKEDRSYMDKYMNQGKENTDTPNRVESIQKLRPKIWKIIMVIIISMALIMPSHVRADEYEGPYRTVLPKEDPMFTLTDHAEIHEIENTHENFTLALQTSRLGPFVMVSTDQKIQGYHKITNIVDLAPFAIEAHNANKFLEEHNSKKDYSSKLGWKVPFKGSIQTKYEYLLYPFKIDFDECKITCPILNSTMINELEQVREGTETFQAQLHTDNSFIWIKTEQKQEIISDWSWDQIYKYELELDGIKIYPENANTMTNVANCTAFMNGKMVTPDRVGHVYKYYNRGEYNWHEAYKLEAAMNSQYECMVMVPQEERGVRKSHNDHHCMCVRNKQNRLYTGNALESKALTDSFKDIIDDIKIEDWRMVSNPNQTITLLNDDYTVSGYMHPSFPNINKHKLEEKRAQFLTERDITRLEISKEKVGELKAKDVMKGLAKLMVSHPSLITGTHDQIQDMLAGKPGNIQLIKTSIEDDTPKSSDELFAQHMNQLHSPMQIRKNKGVITVQPKNHKPINWQKISTSGKASDAELGINEARHHILEYRRFQKEILPNITDSITIPKDQFQNVEVNYEAETIILPQHRGTYIEIDIFVPIFLDQENKKYQITALPYDYDAKSNEYTRKETPDHLYYNPNKGGNKDNGEPETPCELAMVQGTDHLDTCPNEAIKLDEINEMMSFSNYRIFIIGKIGTASISCPGTRLRWLPFNHQIQVILLHDSCYLETRMSIYNLQILPKHNIVTNGISTTLLLAYNITEPWVPTKNTRWILLIIIFAILATIGFTLITGVAMLIKANPWFMIMKGEVPNDNKFKLLQYIMTKISQRKQKGTEKDQKQDIEQGVSYENLSEVDNDPEYQSYFYRTFGDEISQYQTAIRKNKFNQQATLSKREINPQCMAEALTKTKEAIRNHEENEAELELPNIEVHHYSQPQKLDTQHGKPAKH